MINDDHWRAGVDALIAATGVASALLLEHAALWPHLDDLELAPELAPLPAYALGTATIGAGVCWWALRQRLPMVAAVECLIIGAGGATIGGVRLIRYWTRLDRARAARRGRLAGQVAGGRWGLDEAFEKYGAGN